MLEPLLERERDPMGASMDPSLRSGQIMIRCLVARVHLLRNADSKKVIEMLSPFESSAARSELEPALRGEVALWLGWSRAWQDPNEYDKARALNLLDEAWRAFDESLNPSGLCWSRIAQAHAYFMIDEIGLMKQALSDAAALQDRLSDRAARAWIDYLSVPVARFEGRYIGALEYVDSLQRFGEEMRDENALGRALAQRAVLEYELGRKPEDVIASASRARTLLSRSAVVADLALLDAYYALVGASMRAGRWKEAENLIDEGLARLGLLDAARGYLLLHRSRLLEYRGDFDGALAVLDDIGPHLERRHRSLAAGIGIARAGVLMRKKAFAEARAHFDRALRLARDVGDIGHELRALLIGAQIEITRKSRDEALQFMREAERHADHFSILPIAAQRFLIQGYVAAASEYYDDARAYFTQALSAYSLIGDVYSQAVAQCALARVAGSAAELRNYAASALRVCEQLRATPLAQEARRLLRNAPLMSESAADDATTDIGAIMARAAISVDLVAEAWLQAAEVLAPARWLVVYTLTEDGTWRLVHGRGQLPEDLAFPDPSVDRVCEDGVDWVRLRGLPAPAFFFGMECGGEDDPACAAIERRLAPWIPVVSLALEHALLRSARLSIAAAGTDARDSGAALEISSNVGVTTPSVSAQIRRVRSGHSPVVIIGERGVGRRRVARTIHASGDRRDGPFVSVSCTTRPAEALETMLFGSDADSRGALHSAIGGCLYLEDIDALPLEVQSRLLHFLREGGPLLAGGEVSLQSDVRIIASCTNGLDHFVREGAFREELYYRLNLVSIRIPPLRERREEIPLLVQQFLREFTAQRTTTAAITSRAMDLLIRYDWPGNVRQLRNEMERLVADAPAEPFLTIDIEDLSAAIREFQPLADISRPVTQRDLPLDGRGLDDIMAITERSVIEQALRRHDGQVSATADALGLSRQGLYKKLKRLGIDLADFQAQNAESVSEPS